MIALNCHSPKGLCNDNSIKIERINKMTKKEKIISIALCVSMILLIISSITTVTILKHKNHELVKELIKTY